LKKPKSFPPSHPTHTTGLIQDHKSRIVDKIQNLSEKSFPYIMPKLLNSWANQSRSTSNYTVNLCIQSLYEPMGLTLKPMPHPNDSRPLLTSQYIRVTRCAGAKTASILPKKHKLPNTAPKKALQTLKKSAS